MVIATFLMLGLTLICGNGWGIEVPTHARNGRLYELIRNTSADLARGDDRVEAKWFSQRLDHFASESGSEEAKVTFQQRYYNDDTHWTAPDGPVILSIGGEGSLDHSPTGFIKVLARAWGAKILALEHRFYGQSVPNQDLSTKNLRYLTVQQALADLAYFQKQYQAKLPSKKNKWIAIGGSYPGALAAWFRVAYPKTTLASLSSSGVVLPIYEFTGFDEQVAMSAGKECADVLRRTTAAFEKSLRTVNATQIKHLFGAETVEDPDFFYMVADAAAMAVQYGHKEVVCKQMLDADRAGTSLIDAFAKFTTDMYGPEFGSSCFYDTNCLADYNQHERWPQARSWRWQKCSQLAYFQIAPATGSLRASMVNISYHEQQCHRIFGKDTVNPAKGVQEIIKLYGGVHPKTHHVFFSNGGDDPWQRASIVKNVSADLIANLAVCDSCGHCGDLGSSFRVPEPLIEQRKEIMEVMTGWIEDDSLSIHDRSANDAEVEATKEASSTVWMVAAAMAIAALAVVARVKLIHRNPSRLNYGYMRLDLEQ